MTPAAAPSRYEANVSGQCALVRAVLRAPKPAWMRPPVRRKAFLVGVGSNHHAARMAAWLWSRAGLDARAVHAYDFVERPYRLSRGDLGIFLSHRAAASFTVEAERMARRAGAETVAVCGAGARWDGPPRRLETCPLEDTGAFTKSFTTTMAWLLRWAGKPSLLAPLRRLEDALAWGPAFPALKPGMDVVLIGDGLREWVATETALKLQETTQLPARSFGLEEFLHGPQTSLGRSSLVIAFSAPRASRWDAALAFLRELGTPVTEVRSDDWAAQIVWGQRLAADACRRLGIDPDAVRMDDPVFARARRLL